MAYGKLSALVLALVMLAGAQNAQADILGSDMLERWELEQTEFICPLGGEAFAQATGYPHMFLVSYPDGSHMGDTYIEQQIPECPANKLLLIPNFDAEAEYEEGNLVYHTYSADELAQLPSLLIDPEFLALSSGTRQLRAYWLASRLQMSALNRLTLLMQSPYGVDTETGRVLANQAIVRDGPELIAQAATDDNRYYYHMRVIDALRQLGLFDEANALLPRLDAAVFGEQDAGPEDEDYIDENHVLATRIEENSSIATAIAQGNTDRFALVMLEGRAKSDACSHYSPLLYRFSARIPIDCEPVRAELIAGKSELGDPFDIANLDESLLGETSAEPEPSEIVSRCEADDGNPSGDDAADDALYSLCWDYRQAIDDALALELGDDDAAFETVCLNANLPGYEPCRIAGEIRTDRLAYALLQDRDGLTANCAATDLYARPLPLVRACYALEHSDGTAYWADHSPFEDRTAQLRALVRPAAIARLIALREGITAAQ